MLGSLKAVNAAIDGVTPDLKNPDTNGNPVKAQALAQFQAQLQPDPDHHFPAVDLQIFGGDLNRVANMQGFVKSYFNQQRDVGHSQKIMYYFAQKDLPVLTTLALEFAVFNRWFASIPGPTICNRAFAHYGTSFGRVDRYLVGFSPYENGSYLEPISARCWDEWILHCSCGTPSYASRWNWNELKMYVVPGEAHRRGYGPEQEIVCIGVRSQPSESASGPRS